MKIALIILANLVAIAIVAFAIFRLEAQEFSLRLVLPKYPTFETEGAENVDKKFLIEVIGGLNHEYKHTESIYKKALKTRKSIIHILIVTLLIEVALLSILVFVVRKKAPNKDKQKTQQAA